MSIDVLYKQKRRSRIKLLEKCLVLYEELRTKRGLDNDEIETSVTDIRELAKLKRIDRSENDVLYFMYEYFSDNRNPENEQNLIPAGVNIEDAPTFHQELCGILSEVSTVYPTARIG